MFLWIKKKINKKTFVNRTVFRIDNISTALRRYHYYIDTALPIMFSLPRAGAHKNVPERPRKFLHGGERLRCHVLVCVI